MLRDLLCALGFACAPVKPDVSGHTILNLLLQTNAQEELILPALGSLYEDVNVVGSKSEQESAGYIVYLKRDGQRVAWLSCDTLRGAALEVKREEYQDKFSIWAEVGRSLPGQGYSGRADCSFFYEGGKAETNAFMEHLQQWGHSQIGIHPDTKSQFLGVPTFATEFGAPRGMSLNIFDFGSSFRLIFDVP